MQAQMQSESREATDGRTDKIEMHVTATEIIVTQLYKLGKNPKQMIQTFDISSLSCVWLETLSFVFFFFFTFPFHKISIIGGWCSPLARDPTQPPSIESAALRQPH